MIGRSLEVFYAVCKRNDDCPPGLLTLRDGALGKSRQSPKKRVGESNMVTAVRMAKNLVQAMANKFGYRIVPDIARDPAADIRKFVRSTNAPMIFDIGANHGQTVKYFKLNFPGSTIHSFEASPSTYEILEENTRSATNVHCWNSAMGATRGSQTFLENSNSDMSSFLQIGETGWGKIERQTTVNVETVDDFRASRSIDYIDVLKSDTQGYELEVFKGADRSLQNGDIGLVYFEVNFMDMYKGLPKVHELFKFLDDRGFSIVSFYQFYYQKNTVSWTDVLFVHQSLKELGPEI